MADTRRKCCFNWKRFHVSKRLCKVYISCFLSMFATAFSNTMVFPILPFMVKFLLPEIEIVSIGKYAGAIAASLFLGRTISSYVWGAIADSKGRKVVLITSGVLSGLSSGAFGFSTSYPMAIATRLLLGLFNGIVTTVKAVISESSDDSNQALGMTVITSAYGTGLILGPAVAGAIADPIGQYNLTITDPVVHYFLTTFPYSLPCIVSMLLYILSAVVVLICLPETLTKKKSNESFQNSSLNSLTEAEEEDEFNGDTVPEGHSQDESLEEEQTLDQSSHSCNGTVEDSSVPNTESTATTSSPGFVLSRNIETPNENIPLKTIRTALSNFGRSRNRKHKPLTDSESLIACEEAEENLLDEQEHEEEIEQEERSRHSQIKRRHCCTSTSPITRLRQMRKLILQSLKDLVFFMRDHVTRNAIFIYSIYSFGFIAFDEIYSLWSATPRYHGGLGFPLHNIGISLTVVGVLLLPLSFILFPLLERYIGLIKTFQLSATGHILAMVLLPNLHYIENTPAVWIMLIMMVLVIRVCIVMCMAASFIFVNNSVTFDKLGSVNGLAMTITAAFRTFAPLLAGTIYSVSLTNGLGFPLNYNLVFIIFGGFFVLLVMAMVACLPQSITKQKVAHAVTDRGLEKS